MAPTVQLVSLHNKTDVGRSELFGETRVATDATRTARTIANSYLLNCLLHQSSDLQFLRQIARCYIIETITYFTPTHRRSRHQHPVVTVFNPRKLNKLSQNQWRNGDAWRGTIANPYPRSLCFHQPGQ